MVVMPGTFALIAVMAGNVFLAIGTILGQATGSTPADFAPWITGAGSVTTVGGLIYLARLLATGQLVARDVAAESEALKEMVRTLTALEEKSAERERSYHSLLVRRYEAQSGRSVPRKDGD